MAVAVLCFSLLAPIPPAAAADAPGVTAPTVSSGFDEPGDPADEINADGTSVSNPLDEEDMLDPLTLEPLAAGDDAGLSAVTGIGVGADAGHQSRAIVAPIVPLEHVIDVAVVRPAGSKTATTISDDGVTSLIKKLSSYWSTQTAGQISVIRQSASILRYTSEYSCSEPGSLMPDAATRFGTTDSAYNTRTGRHLLVIVPKGCGSTGQASVGIGDMVVSPANGGVIWMQDVAWGLDVVAHEFGHNLGLRHANSHECPNTADGQPVFEGTPGATPGSFSNGCSTNEYGDRVDIMGNISIINGQINPAPTVLSVSNALSLGVIAPEAIERVSLVGGAQRVDKLITLSSVSATTGTRGVVATDPISGAEYIFEYRDGSGADAQTLFGRGKLSDYGVGFGIRMLTNRPRASSDVFTVIDPSVYYGRRQHFEAGETLTSRTGGVSVQILSISGGVARLAVVLGAKPLFPTPVGSSVPTIDGELTPGSTLSVDPGIWSTGTFAYEWAADGVVIADAHAPTLTLGAAESGKAITVMVTGTKADYLPASETSAPTAKVAGATPVIAGEPTLGATLVATTPGWADGTSFSFHWTADGTAIPGATESSFTVTPLQIGRLIAVQVTGVLSDFAEITRMSAPLAPVPAATLRYSFTPEPGQILSWPDADLFATSDCCRLGFRWLANGVPVAGATTPSITVPTVVAAGTVFTLEVAVRSAAPLIGGASDLKASFSGEAVVGSTLYARSDGVALSDLAPQWLANGVALKGATQTTLIVPAGAAGKKISVQLTWPAASLKATSALSLRVSKATIPFVAGVAATGAVLTAQPGSWTTSMVRRYQWAADGKPITGATKPTFTVPSTLLGATLSVTVTGSRSGFAPVSRTSASTAAILLPLSATKPAIIGVAKVNKPLTTKVAAWGPGDVALTYQWFANGSAIAEATGVGYTPTTATIGKRLTVTVTGAKDGYRSVTLTSAVTAKVAR